MAALTLHGISKRFGAVSVLEHVSLDVESGEFVVLLGASGSGKSTLLRIVAGLEVPDEGSVAIGGTTATERAPSQRDVAMVFQNYALYPHKTVAENIAVPLEMRRLSGWQRLPAAGLLSPATRTARRQIAEDVRSAAETVGIERLLDRRPSQLSGGQQQRVALARAMVRRPRLLLMDEPLSNLDAKLRTRLRAEISELHSKIRATIIYVTHDQAEAMTMADRIAVMVDGRIIQIGRPQELYHGPCDVRVAELLGNPSINLVRGTALGDRVEAGGLRFALDRGTSGAVRVGFRPEAAKLLPSPFDIALANATLTRIEHLGAELLLHLALSDGQRVIVRQDAESSPALGERVQLVVPDDKLYLFDEQGLRMTTRVVGRAA